MFPTCNAVSLNCSDVAALAAELRHFKTVAKEKCAALDAAQSAITDLEAALVAARGHGDEEDEEEEEEAEEKEEEQGEEEGERASDAAKAEVSMEESSSEWDEAMWSDTLEGHAAQAFTYDLFGIAIKMVAPFSSAVELQVEAVQSAEGAASLPHEAAARVVGSAAAGLFLNDLFTGAITSVLRT